MARVFISYSRKDFEFAKRLTGELQKSELDFWIDWEGIPPTVDWWKEIEKGIEEADAFLFFISPDSAKSKICGQEIDTAVKNGKRIIPIVLREIEWQDTPPQLGHLNYIFFSREDEFNTAVQKLLTAIHTDYEWTATHRRLQVKALEWERTNKENSFLLRGKDLQDAEQQLVMYSSKDPYPTDIQREYVLTSRKATDKQRRTTTVTSIAAAIALAGLAIFGFIQAGRATTNATESQNNAATAQAASTQAVFNANEAQTQAAIAQAASTLAVEQRNIAIENDEKSKIARSADLTSQSLIVRDTNFPVSMLLSVEAFNTYQTVETLGLLMNNVFTPPHLLPSQIEINDYIATLAFSPDGKILATSGDKKIDLWDTKTWQPIATLEAQEYIYDLVFSPDGKYLVSSSGWDDTIMMWNMENTQAAGRLKSRYTNNAADLAFSPDGQSIAVSGNGTINIWDVKTINNINPFQSPKLSINGGPFAFSPDGKVLAASQDNIVILRDPTTGFATGQPLGEHTTYIVSILFSPDGKIIASTDSTGTTKLWNATTKQQIGQPLNPNDSYNSYQSIAFSPDSKSLLIEYGSGALVLWEMRTQQKIGPPIELEGSTFALSPDGKTLASGSGSGIDLWGVGPFITGPDQPNIQPLIMNADQVLNLAFSADGNTLALAGFNSFGFSSYVKFFNTTTGQFINQIANEFTGNTNNVVYDSQGNILAVRNEGGPAYFSINNIKTGQHVTDIDVATEDPISSVSLSNDLQKLVLGNYDGSITLWDVQTGQLIGQPIHVQTDEVAGVALSPGGNILASSSREGIIILSDMATGKRIGQLQNPFDSDVLSLAFSPDGNALASGSADGNVLLWDVDSDLWIQKVCQQAGRNFTQNEWLKYFPSEEYRITCPHWSSGE